MGVIVEASVVARTSCSLDQGDCSGDCACQCVRCSAVFPNLRYPLQPHPGKVPLAPRLMRDGSGKQKFSVGNEILCARDGIRGHLAGVSGRKTKSKGDAENKEKQALLSPPGPSRGQGVRHPDRTNLGMCNHGPGPLQCCGEGRGGAGGDPKKIVLAGKAIFGPPALKGPGAVIARCQVSSVSGGSLSFTY